MKLTDSQEEYLKTIYMLEKSKPKIRVTDIANRLKITKPRVNMLWGLWRYQFNIWSRRKGKANYKKTRYFRNVFSRSVRN